jgi:uncharacterized phiE125 gp8 family phage protein
MSDSTCYEVITLSEIKSWARIDNDADDDELIMIRNACVEYAESYCNEYFITRYVIGLFNKEKLIITSLVPFPYIQIDKPPTQSISLVETMIDGIWTITDPSTYSFDRSASSSKVMFSTIPEYDTTIAQPFRISFISGYGPTGDDVPHSIRLGLKAHILYMYENRGDVIAEGGIDCPHEAKLFYNKNRHIYVF